MTWRAVDRVLDHSKSENATRLVLIALASFANDDGFAWPGMTKLMRRTRLARSTVWTQLRTLRRIGEIALHEGPVPGREHGVSTYTYRILVSGSDTAVSGYDASLVSGSDTSVASAVSGSDTDELSGRRAAVSGSDTAAHAARVSILNNDVQDLNPPVSDYSHPSRSHAVSGSSTKKERSLKRSRNVNAEATLADAHVNGTVERVDGGSDLFWEPKGETPFRNPLASEVNGVPMDEVPTTGLRHAQGDLLETAHVELGNLASRNAAVLRRVLEQAGWDELRDGKVTGWLACQRPGRLADIIAAARNSQRTARAS
jgi:hypothetical protein